MLSPSRRAASFQVIRFQSSGMTREPRLEVTELAADSEGRASKRCAPHTSSVPRDGWGPALRSLIKRVRATLLCAIAGAGPLVLDRSPSAPRRGTRRPRYAAVTFATSFSTPPPAALSRLLGLHRLDPIAHGTWSPRNTPITRLTDSLTFRSSIVHPDLRAFPFDRMGRLSLAFVLAALPYLLSTRALSYADDVELLHSGRPQVGLWQAIHAAEQRAAVAASASSLSTSEQSVFGAPKSDPSDGSTEDPEHPLYKPQCFPQPLDHFDKHNKVTFCQRYWVSTEFFKKGSKGADGPVFVLDGGETSGANRLPFLETGIINILSNATNGIGIILEHRYYGQSLPSHADLPDLSTSSLRFLNNEQAEADSARFIEHVSLAHLGVHDSLSPSVRPWIYYGGSYAGARAAHMRKGHPDTVFGAIASSAVIHAQVDYWEYFDAIRQWAPERCMSTLQGAIEAVDGIMDRLAESPYRDRFQGLFGLEGLKHKEDFGEVLASPLSGWQARNWDPEGELPRHRLFTASVSYTP